MKNYLGIIYVAAVTLITGLSTVQAQGASRTGAPKEKFEASLFGSYSSSTAHSGGAGAGVGFSFFFNDIVGVSADVQKDDLTGAIEENLNLSASVVLRYPIDAIRLTPYALVGADYNHNRIHPIDSQSDEFNAHAGLGAAFGISKHISVFAEGRLLLFDAYERTYSARAGIRFGF